MHPVAVGGEPGLGPRDHRRVQVDRVDLRGAEALQHQLRAVARSAADFEGSAAWGKPTAEAQQYRHLVEALQPAPRRRVDQGCFRSIHQHSQDSFHFQGPGRRSVRMIGLHRWHRP